MRDIFYTGFLLLMVMNGAIGLYFKDSNYAIICALYLSVIFIGGKIDTLIDKKP